MDSAETETQEKNSGWQGWIWIRVLLFGSAGVGTGLLSCRVMLMGDARENAGIWVMAPGLVFGVFWLVAAWIPGALIVRPQIRRSPIWSLAFLAGVTLSYVGAYYTAFYSAQYLDETMEWGKILPIAGALGGLPGSLGLVCMWSLLFQSVHSWFTKSLLTFCGVLLGTTLAVWDADQSDPATLYLFFAIWQGGMSLALAAIDATLRIRDRNGGGDYFQP